MIPLPVIDIKINMAGIAQSMKLLTGTSFQPNDLYDVYNTARDPDGQPYFWAVNNGTGIKRGSNGRNMRFYAAGRLISTRFAGPNPAYHMRERTIPLIRKYFSERVSGTASTTSRASAYTEGLTQKFKKTTTGLDLESRGVGQQLFLKGIPLKLTAEYWVQIMEDVMDYTIAMLARFTPTLKSEYYQQGYTTEPGTLKASYEWVRRGSDLFPPKENIIHSRIKAAFTKTFRGSFLKRKKFGGSSYRRLTIPSEAIAKIIQGHPAARGLFTKLKRIHTSKPTNTRPRIQ